MKRGMGLPALLMIVTSFVLSGAAWKISSPNPRKSRLVAFFWSSFCTLFFFLEFSFLCSFLCSFSSFLCSFLCSLLFSFLSFFSIFFTFFKVLDFFSNRKSKSLDFWCWFILLSKVFLWSSSTSFP